MKECQCGEEIPLARWELGERYRVCLWCGEEAARMERKSWTVVQEYQKGGYQFITQASARTALKQTNQKSVRS